MKKKNFSFFTLSALFSVLAVPSGYSAKISWTGSAGNNDFNTSANWASGVPGAGDIARFEIDAITSLSSDTTIQGLFVKSQSEVYIDTGNSTLTMTDSEAVVVRNSGIEGSDLTMTGNFVFGSATAKIETLGGSSLLLDNATLSTSSVGLNQLDIIGEGLTILRNTVIDNSFGIVAASHELVLISGPGNEVDGAFVLDGSALFFEEPSAQLTLGNALSTTAGGAWLFDLTDTDSDSYISVTGGITGLENIDLDVSNISWSVNDFNPVILADYGTLAPGSEFKSISGLLPGQKISYNYRGLNQIAIVPEPSISIPILAGFLPLFGFRRRSRR